MRRKKMKKEIEETSDMEGWDALSTSLGRVLDAVQAEVGLSAAGGQPRVFGFMRWLEGRLEEAWSAALERNDERFAEAWGAEKEKEIEP